jgi:hypothetical protein
VVAHGHVELARAEPEYSKWTRRAREALRI